MLVYANSFGLAPHDGVDEVIKQIAIWVGRINKMFIDPEILANGIRELRTKKGAILSSLSTLDENKDIVYLYFFCAKYQHSDPIVSGRRWTTEIGLNKNSQNDHILCSVLLRVDAISVRVNQAVQVTRPGVVQNIIENCNPIEHTPSAKIIQLTEDNSEAFSYEVERQDRSYPIVLISYNADGIAPVRPERLRQLMIGLAQVIEIPREENTFRIENQVGRKYMAFGGAVNIIYPYQGSGYGGFCKTVLMAPQDLRELSENDIPIDSNILSIITHRTNIPNYWKHISTERVRQESLRLRIGNSISDIEGNMDSSIYEDLINDAAKTVEDKAEEIAQIKASFEEAQMETDLANAEIESLKYALSNVTSRSVTQIDEENENYNELILDALHKKISLLGALTLVRTMMSEKIVVLNTAISSAKESDRRGFSHGDVALDLLLKLCTDYWSNLASGQGDEKAISVFGRNGFAPKEKDKLSNAGKKRRTFLYKGDNYFMERHLKFGVKDSLAETLRIHFAWKSEERKIIVGHCGKHLDF